VALSKMGLVPSVPAFTIIHGSFSQLYVEMIGMPLIMNQMSNAANY
jgi:hypothetical protein